MPRLRPRRPTYNPGDSIWYDLDDTSPYNTETRNGLPVTINARSGKVIALRHISSDNLDGWEYLVEAKRIDDQGVTQPLREWIAQSNIIPAQR